MATAKLREGDTVVVLTGKDRGKTGELIDIKQNRVKVKGLNLVYKCHRRNPQQDEEGGIRQQEAYLDKSNVAYWDTTNKVKISVGIKTLDDGKRVRVNKRTGEALVSGGPA